MDADILGVTNLSVRTRDIYGQTAVSALIRISITWSPETNVWTLEGSSLAHLTWGVDRWLAVVNGRLCSSTDLTSWQAVEVPPKPDGTIRAMAWSAAGVVAVGSNGLIAFSADGNSWSGQGVGSGNWNALAAFGPIWVAAGDGGQLAASIDAQSWRVATVLPDDNLIGLAASARAWLGIGANGNVVELSGVTNLVSDSGESGRAAAVATWPSQSLGTNVMCQGSYLGRDSLLGLATFSLPQTLYEQWAASLPPGSNPDFLQYALGGSAGGGGGHLRVSMAGPDQAQLAFDGMLRPDARYIVEESADLSVWTYALDLPGMYPSPGPLKFFLLRVEPIPLW